MGVLGLVGLFKRGLSEGLPGDPTAGVFFLGTSEGLPGEPTGGLLSFGGVTFPGLFVIAILRKPHKSSSQRSRWVIA